MPISVQILSTLVFGAFAITATALAFVHFWPAGVVLAVILAWRGGFAPQSFARDGHGEIDIKLHKLGPEADQRRGSGNASFDAYREDLLQRLEQERQSFDGFLGRLRAAKDQTEFDHFMEERAAKQARDPLDDPGPVPA